MKNTIISLGIVAVFSFFACSKQRTCNCTNKNTTTTVTTPRTSGSSTTTVGESNSTNEYTYAKISKNDMIKYGGCVSSTETSTDTYTTTVSTPTVLSVGSVTYNGTVQQPADVTRMYVYESTCDLK